MVLTVEETVERVKLMVENSIQADKETIDSIFVNFSHLKQYFPLGEYNSSQKFLYEKIISHSQFLDVLLATDYYGTFMEILERNPWTYECLSSLVYEVTFKRSHHDSSQNASSNGCIKRLKTNRGRPAYYPPFPGKDDVLTECQIAYWKMALEKEPQFNTWYFERNVGNDVRKGHRVEKYSFPYNWLCKPITDSQTSAYLVSGFHMNENMYSPFKGFIDNEAVLPLICEKMERYAKESKHRAKMHVNPNIVSMLKNCTRFHDYASKSTPERLILELAHGKFDCLKEVLQDLSVTFDWPESVKNFLMDSFRFSFDVSDLSNSSRFRSTSYDDDGGIASNGCEDCDPEWREVRACFADNLESSNLNWTLYAEYLFFDKVHPRPGILSALIRSKYASRIQLRFITENVNIFKQYITSANDEAYELVMNGTKITEIIHLVKDIYGKVGEEGIIIKEMGKQRAYDFLRRGAFLPISPKDDFLRPCEDDNVIDSVIKSICRREIPDLTILSYEMMAEQFPSILRDALFKLLERRLSLYMTRRIKARLQSMSLTGPLDWRAIPLEDLIENEELRMAVLCVLFSKIKSPEMESDQSHPEFHLFTTLYVIQLCRRS